MFMTQDEYINAIRPMTHEELKEAFPEQSIADEISEDILKPNIPNQILVVEKGGFCYGYAFYDTKDNIVAKYGNYTLSRKAGVKGVIEVFVWLYQTFYLKEYGSELVVKPKQIWKHSNGISYEVMHLANIDNPHPMYPPAVVYKTVGTDSVWTKNVTNWYSNMTLIQEAPIEAR